MNTIIFNSIILAYFVYNTTTVVLRIFRRQHFSVESNTNLAPNPCQGRGAKIKASPLAEEKFGERSSVHRREMAVPGMTAFRGQNCITRLRENCYIKLDTPV